MPKVFVGVRNTAGNAASIASALRSVGVFAKSYGYSIHPFGYPCDYEGILYAPSSHKNISILIANKYSIRLIRSLQKIWLLITCIVQYKIFIFISTQTFFSNKSDLRILSCLGKRIVFVFVGCPERDPSDPLNQTDNGYCSFCKDDHLQKHCCCTEPARKKKIIQTIEKFADLIFSARDTNGYLSGSAMVQRTYIVDNSCPIGDYLLKFNNIDKITIAHFPSNKLLKGTYYIEDVIKNLPQERIKYFSRRLTNIEIHNKLEQTHILIDQFGSMHGLLAVEAMARGCVVICRLSRWFREDHPEIPVVSCEPEELRDVLLDLMDHPDKMRQIAVDSIAYYSKYHSPQAAGAYYKAVLHL